MGPFMKASIRGQLLFKTGLYLRKYGSMYTMSSIHLLYWANLENVPHAQYGLQCRA